MPDRCKLTQTIFFLAALGNNLLTYAPQLKSQICSERFKEIHPIKLIFATSLLSTQH